jgi:hypothetical protein
VIDKRHLPSAIKKVLPEVKGGVQELLNKSRTFLEVWSGASREFVKPGSNMEENKNGKNG